MDIGQDTLDANELFEAVERDEGPQPGLIHVWGRGGPAYELWPLAASLTLGRCGGEAQLLLDDPLVSRSHAEITWDGQTAMLCDQGSRNGLYLNGAKHAEGPLPSEPAVIRVGHSIFIFCPDTRGLSGRIERIDGALLDPCLRRSWSRIERGAGLSRHLLITGESGTGKELAARMYHRVTGSVTRPFVAVNCATIPEGVAERLLFGTRKGAYSSASADAAGYVQAAHGGTLFLDEFGELGLKVQAKLLRFLENGEALSLGAVRPQKLDVRVCLATNRDLRAEVTAGRFRGDLYYRVAEPSAALPPLRRRPQAIPSLVHETLAVSSLPVAHPLLIESCLLRPWPGNVRELRMALRTAGQEAACENRDHVLAKDLPHGAGREVVARAQDVCAPPSSEAPAAPRKKEAALSSRQLDRPRVVAALERTEGNISQSARALGIHRNQLRRWLSKHHVDAGHYRR